MFRHLYVKMSKVHIIRQFTYTFDFLMCNYYTTLHHISDDEGKGGKAGQEGGVLKITMNQLKTLIDKNRQESDLEYRLFFCKNHQNTTLNINFFVKN